MLMRLFLLTQRLATRRRVWGCLALLLSVMALVNFTDLPFTGPRLRNLTAGGAFLDLRLFYTAQEALTAISGYGAIGRAACVGFYATWDVAIPLLAFAFSAMSLGLLWANKRAMRFLLLAPLAALTFDLLENCLLAIVMIKFPGPFTFLAAAAGVATLLKWLSYGISVGLVLAGVGRRLWPLSARTGAPSPGDQNRVFAKILKIMEVRWEPFRPPHPSRRYSPWGIFGGANFLRSRVAMKSASVQVGARSIKGKNFVTKEGRKAQWKPTRNIMTPIVTRSTPASTTQAKGPVHSAGAVIN